MSFDALAAVKSVKAGSGRVILLLYVLAENAGADGTCWPRIGTIAQGMRGSADTARRALQEAEALGLIRIEHRRRKDGGQSSSRYVLTYYAPAETPLPLEETEAFGPLEPDADGAPELALEGSAEGDPPLADCEGGGRKNGRGPLAKTGGAYLNQLSEPKGSEDPQGAGEASPGLGFWETLDAIGLAVPPLVRKRTNFKKARSAWSKLARKFGEAQLLAAARAWAADPALAKLDFPPGVDVWLSGEMFRPYLGQPPVAGAAPMAPRFEGPAELMAELEKADLLGWVAGAAWDAASRTLTCRLEFQADTIRRRLRQRLTAMGITVRHAKDAQQGTGTA